MIYVDLTKAGKGMCFVLDSVRLYFSLREGETFITGGTNFLREASGALMLARDRFIKGGSTIALGEIQFRLGQYAQLRIFRDGQNSFLFTFISTDGKGKLMEVDIPLDDQEFLFCFDELIRLHSEMVNKGETYKRIIDEEGGNIELERFKKKE